MKNAHEALTNPSINLFSANVLGPQWEILGVVCHYDGLGLPLYLSLCYEFLAEDATHGLNFPSCISNRNSIPEDYGTSKCLKKPIKTLDNRKGAN